MEDNWWVLFRTEQRDFFLYHERLNTKYFSRLNNNPNRIRHQSFETEDNARAFISNLGEDFQENQSLESLAFDWH